MKVKEVIEYLQQFNPDCVVYSLPHDDPFYRNKGFYLCVEEDNEKEKGGCHETESHQMGLERQHGGGRRAMEPETGTLDCGIHRAGRGLLPWRGDLRMKGED